MARKASGEVIASLDAFLRRTALLTDHDIPLRMKDLAEGRMRAPDSSSEPFRRPLALISSENAQIPDDRSRKNWSPSVQTDTAKLAEPTARHEWSSRDPRLDEVRVRYATARAPIAFPEHALAADEASADDVRTRLAHLNHYVASRLQAGELPCVDLPDLHRNNSIYDDKGNVFLGHNVRRLALDRKGGEFFMRILLSLEAASDNLRDGTCATKRGLFYSHRANLPVEDADQGDSDRALAALSNLLGVRRKTLGFVEARRGSVYGRIVIREGAQVVDASQMGRGGYPVPRFTDDAEIVSSDAAFILVVEKMSIAFQLAQARIWETNRCIMVCSEGFPSLSAREFVRSLVDTLGIPALICADADPAGIQLALTFAHGCISTALETPWLACNNVWWVGFYPSDIDRYCKISDLIPLSDTDREHARRLRDHASHTYVNKRVRDELAVLVDRGAKVELDALAHHTPRFVDEYLPKKLFDSELVKL